MKMKIPHNFPKNVSIICVKKYNSEDIKRLAMLAVNVDLGIHLYEMKPSETHPFIGVDGNDMTLSQFDNKIEDGVETIFVTEGEFMAYFDGSGKHTGRYEKEVELTENYTALVTKKGVMVGCTEFTHEAISNLYTASQEAVNAER